MTDDEWGKTADDTAGSSRATDTDRIDRSPAPDRSDVPSRTETTDRRTENGDTQTEESAAAVDPHGPMGTVVPSGSEPMSRLAATAIGVGIIIPVTALVSILPGISAWLVFVGPLVGGGIAGYLRGNDMKESAKTGGLAGCVVASPALLIAGFFIYGPLKVLFGDASAGGADYGLSLLVGVFLLFVTVLGILFAAVAGAIGSMVTDRNAPS